MRQHPGLELVQVFVGVLRVDAADDLGHHDPDQMSVQIKAQRLVDLAKRVILIHVPDLVGGKALGENIRSPLALHLLFHGLHAGQETALKVHGLVKELLCLTLAVTELAQHVFAELSVDRDGGAFFVARLISGRIVAEHGGRHDIQDIGKGVLGIAHDHIHDHRRAVQVALGIREECGHLLDGAEAHQILDKGLQAVKARRVARVPVQQEGVEVLQARQLRVVLLFAADERDLLAVDLVRMLRARRDVGFAVVDFGALGPFAVHSGREVILQADLALALIDAVDAGIDPGGAGALALSREGRDAQGQRHGKREEDAEQFFHVVSSFPYY